MDKPTDKEFCPDVDDIFGALMRLLPRGRAWDTIELSNERTSNIRRFMSGIANSWTKFETEMCDALNQWFCYSASTDLDLWNLDYGIPDECDLYAASVCSKAEAYHSISADSLMRLMEANGYATEMRWLTGYDEEYPGVRSTLNVMVDIRISTAFTDRTLLPFSLGTGRLLGAPLDIQAVACMLERYVPAHCVVQVREAALWNPEIDLGSKLLFWFNADDTADGNVSSWIDRIASMDAVNLNAGAFPVSIPGGPGGQRFISFNGTDQALRVAFAGVIPDDSTLVAFLCIQDALTTDATDRLVWSFGNSAPNERSAGRVVETGPPLANRYQTSIDAVTLADTAQDFSGSSVGVSRRDATTLYSRFRGIPSSPPSVASSPPGSSSGQLTIGADFSVSGARFHSGKIRHIFGCQNMTPHDWMALEAWIAWDILDAPNQLPPTHPYRNMRP